MQTARTHSRAAPSPRPAHRAALAAFLDYLELWLSAAGLVVVFVAARFFGPADPTAFWRFATIVSLVVATVHGCVFFGVRHQRRRQRARIIAEIRAMLRDRVNNDLAVIALNLPEVAGASTRARLDDLLRAVRSLSEQVNTLSEDTLLLWRQRYETVLDARDFSEGDVHGTWAERVSAAGERLTPRGTDQHAA